MLHIASGCIVKCGLLAAPPLGASTPNRSEARSGVLGALGKRKAGAAMLCKCHRPSRRHWRLRLPYPLKSPGLNPYSENPLRATRTSNPFYRAARMNSPWGRPASSFLSWQGRPRT